ncbi:MAG: glycosyltransferase family 4 protein [Candidatus Omnitrophota bacterium]
MHNTNLIIYYCINLFPSPQTGGELFYSKVLEDLKNKEDVTVILPDESDINFLNRPKNALKINAYFIRRFTRLAKKAIILQEGTFYHAFILSNWFIRLFRKDIKIIVSFRQIPSPRLKWGINKLLRDVMLFLYVQSAHLLTVNSEYLSKELSDNYKANKHKIKVVYSSSKVKNNQEKWKRKSTNVVNILCVAHIRELKGQRYLIEALKQIEDYNWKCSLVGGVKEIEYEQELRGLIEKYKLVDKVTLCGRLEGEALVQMYKDADIFVLPSLYEAYGVVIQEAMSFGIPIVASNVGGIPEQLTNEREGILVAPADSEILAKAIRKLIVDSKLRCEMSQASFAKFSKLSSWDMVCEKFFQAVTKTFKG